MNEERSRKLSIAIAAVEQKYHASICFHDYTGQMLQVIPEVAKVHNNLFCSALKERYPSVTGTCVAFDMAAVQRRIYQNPEPFYKYCICGLLEAVIPIFVAGRLSGAMFIGPFPASPPLPADVLHAGKVLAFPLLDKARGKLYPLAPEDMPGLLALGDVLATQLALLAESVALTHSDDGNRKDQIAAFIVRNFCNNIGLPELSAHLGLSVSRTSQVINNEFGVGFSELLNRQRLEYAKSLLVNSQFKIIKIASLCGFRDSAYFHRVFRRNEQLSPLAYRRKYRKKHRQ